MESEKHNHNHHKSHPAHSMHKTHSSDLHSDHDKHAGHSIEDFWNRFIISTLVTVPVLALSHMIQQWLGFKLTFPGDLFVLGVLSTFIFIYGGWPFLKGLRDEVRSNNIGMMTLIGIAITAAWAYSFAITLGIEGMDFYWEMATLIDIMLLGHWLEMKSITGASQALELLVKMMPSIAHLVKNGETKDIPVEQLKKEDMLMVKPGEKIPVDSIVLEGESYLDESMLTGESKPVKKSQGNKVIGGSINGCNKFTFGY